LVVDEEYRFTPDDPYKLPAETNSHENFIDFYKKMPNITSP